MVSCAQARNSGISLRIFLEGSRGVNSLLEKLVLLINYILRNCVLKVNAKNVANQVPMASFGLKLGQNESYGLQGPS